MIRRALSSVSADIVVLPELVTSGYVFSGFEEAESVAVEPSSLAWWGVVRRAGRGRLLRAR